MLPPLNSDLGDKIILLKAAHHPMPMPTETPEQKRILRETIARELPYYVAHLALCQIPSELRGNRFGLLAYHNPSLLAALAETSTYEQVYDFIKRSILFPWKGTVSELYDALASKKAEHAKRLARNPTYLSGALNVLSGIYKDEIRRGKSHKKGRLWSLGVYNEDEEKN